MVNIFEEASEKEIPQWAKFVKAGDSVQGTYIGKIVGQKDGYGNEQIIYQLLQDDGKVINVGFGLNKKVLNMDMATVNFGQIVGFRYKGTIQVKDKFGKPVAVKDFGVHQDSSIVNEVWLAKHKNNMPEVVKAAEPIIKQDVGSNAKQSLDEFVEELNDNSDDDVPFSSPGSLTVEDKLLVIEKLAKEKLGAVTAQEIKDKVMEKTGIAFIATNYDKISAALAAI
jgi:hypothetical protein